MINVDFADIKAVMFDAGSALMGVGIAAEKEEQKKLLLSL
jgi:cell division GTPase FtsZ